MQEKNFNLWVYVFMKSWIVEVPFMMPCVPSVGTCIRFCLRDYDKIQGIAVFLIYIQIGCALIGSLGAFFNGVLLINLSVSLFALVAIENSSQNLGRTYAALLACTIFIDVGWFILFSHQIWNISSDKYGPYIVFSLRLELWMQICGFASRILSSFFWIQMYRIGVSSRDNTIYREADYDLRNSFVNPPSHPIARQTSGSDDALGGSIYDPAYYSSLFEKAQDVCYVAGDETKHYGGDHGSTSVEVSSELRLCVSRSFQDPLVVDKP